MRVTTASCNMQLPLCKIDAQVCYIKVHGKYWYILRMEYTCLCMYWDISVNHSRRPDMYYVDGRDYDCKRLQDARPSVAGEAIAKMYAIWQNLPVCCVFSDSGQASPNSKRSKHPKLGVECESFNYVAVAMKTADTIGRWFCVSDLDARSGGTNGKVSIDMGTWTEREGRWTGNCFEYLFLICARWRLSQEGIVVLKSLVLVWRTGKPHANRCNHRDR